MTGAGTAAAGPGPGVAGAAGRGPTAAPPAPPVPAPAAAAASLRPPPPAAGAAPGAGAPSTAVGALLVGGLFVVALGGRFTAAGVDTLVGGLDVRAAACLVLLLLATLFGLSAGLRDNRALRPVAGVLVLLGYLLLTALWAHPAARLGAVGLDVAMLIALVVTTVLVAAPDPRRAVHHFLLWTLAAAVLFAVAAWYAGPGAQGRYAAFGGGPNVFVRIQCLGVVAAVALALRARSAAWLLPVPLLLYTAFLSGSRGGLASLIVAGAVALAVARRLRPGYAVGVLAVAGGLAVVAYVAGNAALGGVYRRYTIAQLEGSDFSVRPELLRRAWSVLAERPLGGAGLDGFAALSGRYIGIDYPHNIVAQVGADGGAVGLLALVAAVVWLLRHAGPAAGWASWDRGGCLVAAAYLAAASLFSGSYYDARQLWIYLALLGALAVRANAPTPAAPAPAAATPVAPAPATGTPTAGAPPPRWAHPPVAAAGPDWKPMPVTATTAPTDGPPWPPRPPAPPPPPPHAGGTRRRRRRRRVAAALCVALLLPGAAWVGSRGWLIRSRLDAAADLVAGLHRQLRAGDTDAAARTLSALQVHAAAARAHAGDPLWRGLGHLPAAGDDARAVAAVARTVADLSDVGLPALLRAAGGADPARLAPVAGRLPLGPLARAAGDLSTADAVFTAGARRIAALDRSGLAGPVREAVDRLRRELAAAAADVRTAARAAALVPPMFGADGPRSYLLVVQNLAEVRATGGLPGAFAVVAADRGRVRVVDQGSASSLRPFGRPVLPLDRHHRALYSDRLGVYPADVNLTPDFPTAAATLREMYRRRTGRSVDGVLATDPVALTYLLRVQGPIAVAGGPPLSARTAARNLLADTYRRLPSTVAQDRYFAAAARSVFATLTRAPRHPAALLRALGAAAGERRLLVWSARPDEQARLAGTVLAGRLPADDGPTPTVGVFLNDGSGAKLGYYLRQQATLRPADCVGGRREYTLTVRLSSAAPRAGLPRAVTGLALGGHPYRLRTNVVVLAPAGGSVVGVTSGGRPVAHGSGMDRGRMAAVTTVHLGPGESREVAVVLRAGPAASAARHTPRLWLTPRLTSWSPTVETADGCRVGH